MKGMPKGVRVKPRSRTEIREAAEFILKACDVVELPVPIIEILEFKLSEMGIVYDYAAKSDLGVEEGRTYPDRDYVRIREGVYIGAVSERGRDRFTIAHELGHLVLHWGIPLSRMEQPPPLTFYESSEWQAEVFASELLMPVQQIRQSCGDANDIMYLANVSYRAAEVQWEVLKKEGLLDAEKTTRTGV